MLKEKFRTIMSDKIIRIIKMMGRKPGKMGMKMDSEKKFKSEERDAGLTKKMPKKAKRPTEKGVQGKRTGF